MSFSPGPELRWRDSGRAAEEAGKIGWVLELQPFGDLADRERRMGEEPLRLEDEVVLDEDPWRESGRLAEGRR